MRRSVCQCGPVEGQSCYMCLNFELLGITNVLLMHANWLDQRNICFWLLPLKVESHQRPRCGEDKPETLTGHWRTCPMAVNLVLQIYHEEDCWLGRVAC